MAAEYDISNEQGEVRLLISDVGGTDGKSFLFQDEEIQKFLDLRGSVNLAAATALRTIAANEAQVQKRITFLELKTDGPAVSKELRELAKDYEAAEDDDSVFEIARLNRNPANELVEDDEL